MILAHNNNKYSIYRTYTDTTFQRKAFQVDTGVKDVAMAVIRSQGTNVIMMFLSITLFSFPRSWSYE